MSEKRHKINKFANYQNIIVRNSPVPCFLFFSGSRPLIYGFWRNAHDQYTNPLARPLLIALQVPRRLSVDENVRAKEGGKDPSDGSLRFITSHSRFALASTTRKTKRLRRRLVLFAWEYKIIFISRASHNSLALKQRLGATWKSPFRECCLTTANHFLPTFNTPSEIPRTMALIYTRKQKQCRILVIAVSSKSKSIPCK